MTKHVVSNNEAETMIRRLQPFRNSTGSWSGVVAPRRVTYGHLPREYWPRLKNALYVVYSYDTPIAWVTSSDGTNHEGEVPNISYSLTTGQHQWATSRALGIPFSPYDRKTREVIGVPATDTLYGKPRRLRRGGLDG